MLSNEENSIKRPHMDDGPSVRCFPQVLMESQASIEVYAKSGQ